MKRAAAISIIFFFAIMAFPVASFSDQDPKALLENALKAPAGIHAIYEAKRYHEGKLDTLKLEFRSDLVNNQSARSWKIIEPADLKGISIISVGNTRFALRKKPDWEFGEVKPSKLNKRFAGMETTLHDLAFAWLGDAELSFVGTSLINGYTCNIIEARKKKGAKATLPIVRFYIRENENYLAKLEVQNKKHRTLRTLDFFDWENVDGRSIFKKMEVFDEKTRTRTVLTRISAETGSQPSDSFAPAFSATR